jgi:hypothetical protein
MAEKGVVLNPWMLETWNLTQQGQIFKTDPKLAARLRAEAEALKNELRGPRGFSGPRGRAVVTAGGGGGFTQGQIEEFARDAVGAALAAAPGVGIAVQLDDNLNQIIVSVLQEYVEDRIAGLIVNGTNIAWTYDDALGTLQANVSAAGYTDEQAMDAAAAMIQNGTGVTWTYDDVGNTLTPAVSLSPFSTTNLAEGSNLYHTPERVDDRVAALILNGTGIAWTYDDVGNTLTGNVSVTQYTDEQARDALAAFVQNGTGISWSHNDPLDTLTPTVTLAPFSTTDLAEGSNLYHTAERVDDRVAALILNGTGIAWTYDDVGNTLTGNVSVTQYTDEQARDAVGLMLTDSGTIDFTFDDALDTITAVVKAASITEAMQLLADNVTGDASITRHGYMKKLPNNAGLFYDGTGNFSAPTATAGDLNKPEPGSVTVATAKYHMTAVRLSLTSTQRLTVQGTGRIRVLN